MIAQPALADTLANGSWNLRTAFVVFAVLATLGVYSWNKKKQQLAPLPPGPPGHWFYGNTIPQS
jgi:hypothetical protein